MESLVSYGSDDECENERHTAVGSQRRREDDTNYDTVNMDMSEDSGEESEPELPQVEPSPPRHHRDSRRSSDDRSRDSDRRRESPARRPERDRRDRRSPERPRKDDRCDRGDRGRVDISRRGLLGDRPDAANDKIPSHVDAKPFSDRSHDARDAVSPRFVDRRERDRGSRDRDRERDRSRHGRRSEERRSGHSRQRSRSRPRNQPSSSSSERRSSPQTNEYRPSYKVNKKLEVMEKMGLQIKTPCGSMATAQQLRAAASEPGAVASSNNYFNPGVNATKILDQVQKRKMLWANKNKSEAEEAAKWTGTKFSQDQDGKQVSKFMRLMGIKQPEAVPTQPDATVDPNKKQEELFQAMQAQYEVARATTHTMRGVGLGFQRGQF